jgi:DNA-binding GntR family transcriptional regulator
MSVPDRDKPDTVEHQEIVEAFMARDAARAERAVRYHIEAAGKSLISAMRGQV